MDNRQKLGETHGTVSPSTASKRNPPCQHQDFRLLASCSGKEYISAVLSHSDCGNLLHQPQETNAMNYRAQILDLNSRLLNLFS